MSQLGKDVVEHGRVHIAGTDSPSISLARFEEHGPGDLPGGPATLVITLQLGSSTAFHEADFRDPDMRKLLSSTLVRNLADHVFREFAKDIPQIESDLRRAAETMLSASRHYYAHEASEESDNLLRAADKLLDMYDKMIGHQNDA